MTMRRRQLLQAVGASTAGALLTACGGGGGGDSGGGGSPPPPSGTTTLRALLRDGGFGVMLQAAERGGLGGLLDDASQRLTLLAVPDAAFDGLARRLGLASSAALLDRFRDDQWTSIVEYHLLDRIDARTGPFGSADLQGGAVVTRFRHPRRGETTITLARVESAVRLWGGANPDTATFSRVDVGASNGVLHVVTEPILPRGVLTVAQMLLAGGKRFAASLTPSDVQLLDGAGPFTVFAPADEAIGSTTLSSAQLRHHVVPGEILQEFSVRTLQPLDGGRPLTLRPPAGSADKLGTLSHGTAVQARISDVDFYASNGVIHVVDAIIPQ